MRSAGKTRPNTKQPALVNLFSERGVLLGLLFGLLMLLASESPQLPRETRIPLVQAGTLWVMTLAALCSPTSNEAKKTLWEGFNPLLLVFTLWCLFATAISPIAALRLWKRCKY